MSEQTKLPRGLNSEKRPAMFTLTFGTLSDDYTDSDEHAGRWGIAEALRETAYLVREGFTSGWITDSKGEHAGHWELS